MRNTIAILIVLLLVIGAGWWIKTTNVADAPNVDVPAQTETSTDQQAGEQTGEVPVPEEPVAEEEGVWRQGEFVIGRSAGGNDIIARGFGEGEKEILVIGGIHAGYSPNTVSVANELSAALEKGEVSIPDGVRVTVIATLNPDSVGKVAGATGRLNANGVDLNRNFACDWKAEGLWRSVKVSGGASAFSEPESAALRDYVAASGPDAVIAYYAAAGGVYSSSCGDDAPSEQSRALTRAYASASGYAAHEVFDSYEVNGDMTNWLASIDVPAISILLTDHASAEWSKNKAGIESVFKLYAR